MRILGHLARTVVPNPTIQTRNQHQTLMKQFLDLFLVRLDPDDTVILETPHSIAEQRDRVQKVTDEYRLKDVEFELTLRAGDGDGGIVACQGL